MDLKCTVQRVWVGIFTSVNSYHSRYIPIILESSLVPLPSQPARLPTNPGPRHYWSAFCLSSLVRPVLEVHISEIIQHTFLCASQE